ncbi:MAG TPA: aminotransferase class III-fold pyridoxal phosphate-dependent enzyme [Thermoplasmata archaeon]|nr:aminotransferase class III-fold pyridoxal phosphate-dependent enzyme [Thermoplasmata archaeon]
MDPRFEAAFAEYRQRTPRSHALWEHARHRTPLGVHSNYRYLDPYPFYVHRASGVTLWDADENDYLDFNMGFGSLQSGHAHPKLVEALSNQLRDGSVYGYEWERTPEVADRLCRRYGMDQIRFSTTGLEATHHAIRFARAHTQKRYVLKFEGCYHGSHDTLLVGVKPRAQVAGAAEHPNSAPASPGLLPDLTEHTLVAPFNDLEATRKIVAEHRDDLAAIIAEPIPMNMGFVIPDEGFFPGLRELCDERGALLIYDEIKTGAKYPHGASERVGARPDLITLGKSIACGVPLSAIAARPGILDEVGPRKVAHAGTYNSNPLAMTACLASLDHILTEENLERSAGLNHRLSKGYAEVFDDAGVTAHVSSDGVSGTVYFADHPIRNWRDFLTVDGDRSMLYYYLCLNRGLIPSGTGPDEQWTLSVLHTGADVDRHIEILSLVADRLSGRPQAGEIEESV